MKDEGCGGLIAIIGLIICCLGLWLNQWGVRNRLKEQEERIETLQVVVMTMAEEVMPEGMKPSDAEEIQQMILEGDLDRDGDLDTALDTDEIVNTDL